MVVEAGGRISSHRDGQFREYSIYDREILASNGLVHDALAALTV